MSAGADCTDVLFYARGRQGPSAGWTAMPKIRRDISHLNHVLAIVAALDFERRFGVDVARLMNKADFGEAGVSNEIGGLGDGFPGSQ
jgi:hypothetical protein